MRCIFLNGRPNNLLQLSIGFSKNDVAEIKAETEIFGYGIKGGPRSETNCWI